MFNLFKKPKTNYLLQYKNEYGWQVIDIADTPQEAEELFRKYKAKYPKEEYRIKSNPQE